MMMRPIWERVRVTCRKSSNQTLNYVFNIGKDRSPMKLLADLSSYHRNSEFSTVGLLGYIFILPIGSTGV